MSRTQAPCGRVQAEPPPQHGLEADDAWQVAIARYLAERRGLQATDIFEVLAACEEVTRARYLPLATCARREADRRFNYHENHGRAA